MTASHTSVDVLGGQLAAAVREVTVLADTVIQTCCHHAETAIALCRNETSHREDTDQFLVGSRAHVAALRALLLAAATDYPPVPLAA